MKLDARPEVKDIQTIALQHESLREYESANQCVVVCHQGTYHDYIRIRPCIRTRTQCSGESNGISYELDGVAVPGNKLGKAYTWKGIESQLPKQEKQQVQETLAETQKKYAVELKAKYQGVEC